MTVDAPSKINLFLQVTGTRPDGYHTVDLLFYPLTSPADKISVDFLKEDCGTAHISLKSPQMDLMGASDKNLAVRAARAYFESAGKTCPSLNITLEKNIPVAAGLGGGSSDAAAVLLLLQQRYGFLSAEEINSQALKLGADVPFFLNPVVSRAVGIGEKLTPVSGIPSKLPILLAAPEFPVSAAWAYQNMNSAAVMRDSRTCEQIIEALRANDVVAVSKLLRNDLSHALWSKFPILRCIERIFTEFGALAVQVTGSGPVLFALFPDFDSLNQAYPLICEKMDPSIRLIQPFR